MDLRDATGVSGNRGVEFEGHSVNIRYSVRGMRLLAAMILSEIISLT